MACRSFLCRVRVCDGGMMPSVTRATLSRARHELAPGRQSTWLARTVNRLARRGQPCTCSGRDTRPTNPAEGCSNDTKKTRRFGTVATARRTGSNDVAGCSFCHVPNSSAGRSVSDAERAKHRQLQRDRKWKSFLSRCVPLPVRASLPVDRPARLTEPCLPGLAGSFALARLAHESQDGCRRATRRRS